MDKSISNDFCGGTTKRPSQHLQLKLFINDSTSLLILKVQHNGDNKQCCSNKGRYNRVTIFFIVPVKTVINKWENIQIERVL